MIAARLSGFSKYRSWGYSARPFCKRGISGSLVDKKSLKNQAG